MIAFAIVFGVTLLTPPAIRRRVAATLHRWGF